MVAKLSSASTMSAACLDTSVPVTPIAMPMSAALSAGASLTPSPVIATTAPRRCSACTIRSLCSGFTRAYTDTVATVCVERLRRTCAPAPAPVTAVPIARDAELLRDDGSGLRMIAGDHHRADAGPPGTRDGVACLIARRIDHADEAGEDEIALGVLRRGRSA